MGSKNNPKGDARSQINEMIEDGGGCTEAWEGMSALREQTHSNRRNFLKMMGITGVGAAGLGSVGVSSAKETLANPTPPTELEDLSSEEITPLLSGIQNSSDYSSIRSKLVNRGFIPPVGPSLGSPTGVRITNIETEEHADHVVIPFHLPYIPPGSTRSAVVHATTLETQDIIVSGYEINDSGVTHAYQGTVSEAPESFSTLSSHPDIPSYTLYDNLHYDDICYFGAWGCLGLATIAEAVDPIPGDFPVVFATCDIGVGATCLLKDTVERYTSCNDPQVWIYREKWWAVALPTPPILAVPHC